MSLYYIKYKYIVICLGLLFGTVVSFDTMNAQYIDLDTFQFRAILTEDESLFTYSLTDMGDHVICVKPKGENENFIRVLRPAMVNETGGRPLELYTNIGIFKNEIFTVSFRNNIAKNWTYDVQSPNVAKNFKKYYLVSNPNKNMPYKPKGQAVYMHHKNKLKLNNYKEVANRKRPTFNYDFIIKDNAVYLLISIENELYFYVADDTNDLANTSWSVKYCINSPFKQEYFLITRNKVGEYLVHTKSQGEFKIDDFLTSPCLRKINNKNLGNRIFLEDKRTNSSFELTRENYHSLLESEDHISHLNLILNSKN